MNREQQVNELEKMKEQVLANNGEVPQPKPTSDETSLDKTKVLVKNGMGNPAQRFGKVQQLLGSKRNGYVDAIILSFITSVGGGIILYLIISAI